MTDSKFTRKRGHQNSKFKIPCPAPLLLIYLFK